MNHGMYGTQLVSGSGVGCSAELGAPVATAHTLVVKIFTGMACIWGFLSILLCTTTTPRLYLVISYCRFSLSHSLSLSLSQAPGHLVE